MGVIGGLIYQLLFFLKTDNTRPKDIQSILVVRRNRLGDAVITALVLQELKKANPNLNITVITNSYCLSIYEEIFPSFEVVSVPEKYLGSPLLLRFHPKIREMRLRNFDLAINASAKYVTKAIYLLNCFNSKYKIAIGRQRGRQFWELLLDNVAPFDSGLDEKHQVWKMCAVFKRTGLRFSAPPFGQSSVTKVKKILLCPEVNRASSQWPISNWESLSSELQREGYEVLFCASPKFLHQFDHLTQPKSVLELINLIRGFDLVICQEGGTSHLAAVLNKHLITLSGTAIKNTWFPWTVNGHLLEETQSIESISVSEVTAIVKNLSDARNKIDQNIGFEINKYLSN